MVTDELRNKSRKDESVKVEYPQVTLAKNENWMGNYFKTEQENVSEFFLEDTFSQQPTIEDCKSDVVK